MLRAGSRLLGEQTVVLFETFGRAVLAEEDISISAVDAQPDSGLP